MLSKYRRLTPKERYHLELGLGRGLSLRMMAKELGRAPSSLSRELARNSRVYDAEEAERRAYCRRRAWQYRFRKLQGEIERRVQQRLWKRWSPDQISQEIKISAMTIYRYLERDHHEGGRLRKNLRTLRKKRKDRKLPKWKPAVCSLGPRKMIDERPAIVNEHKRIGDWERDLMLGKVNERCLLVLLNRASRKVKLAVIEKKTAEAIHEATVKLLLHEPLETLTNDNGGEFAWHLDTEKALNTKIYFSHRYRPWQRGAVENVIGLLRQYFPRKKSIPLLKPSQLKAIENELNTRPRKCLGYRTPQRVHKELQSLGVALAM